MSVTFSNIIIGAIFGTLFFPIVFLIFNSITIQVNNSYSVLVCRFGKLKKILNKPGFHFWFDKFFPWTKIIPVSLKKDFRCYEEIHLNDSKGTTIIIDLWLEFQIVDPVKSVFHVENLEKFLQSTLFSSATSIFGTYEFESILSTTSDLNNVLKKDVTKELSRWGIDIGFIFISRISLLPEVSKQMFDTVAAKLEKTKAFIEESGKLKAQLLEAQTSSKIAALIAEAKGQYALSISKAFKELSDNEKLFDSYQILYNLSLIKPHRSIIFQGFNDSEMNISDISNLTQNSIDENLYNQHLIHNKDITLNNSIMHQS